MNPYEELDADLELGMRRVADDVVCSEYIAMLLRAYAVRAAEEDRPTVAALCGYGRAGKDQSAELLAEMGLPAAPGCSKVMLPVWATAVGLPDAEVWRDRHKHRMVWKRFSDRFREDDPTKLVKMCLGAERRARTVTGMRGGEEFLACRDQRIVAVTVWIDNPRVPVDPTVDYAKEDCDLVLLNDGSLADLRRRLSGLAMLLHGRSQKGEA